MLWGKYVALGKICCSGENMLLWGEKLLWGEFALGRIRKLAKKERILPIFRKIGEILEKLEEISEDFVVKKKRFGRQ
ncbi:MAG: hypothetical protein KBC30_06175 [Planctomycetes bacterium]|nr:hypothetical protein [Planctomycetota bacterium]